MTALLHNFVMVLVLLLEVRHVSRACGLQLYRHHPRTFKHIHHNSSILLALASLGRTFCCFTVTADCFRNLMKCEVRPLRPVLGSVRVSGSLSVVRSSAVFVPTFWTVSPHVILAVAVNALPLLVSIALLLRLLVLNLLQSACCVYPKL